MEVGGLRIGVRGDRAETDAWLAGLLAPIAVDGPASPNYSVVLASGPGDLHLLHWGGCLVGRARTRDELARILAVHLGGHGAVRDGCVRLDAHALVAGGRTVVVCRTDLAGATKVAARLRDLGATVEQRPWVDLELATATLVAPEPVGLAGVEQPAVPALPVAAVALPAAVCTGVDAADLALLVHHRVVEGFASLADVARFRTTFTTLRVDRWDPGDVASVVRSGFSGSSSDR